MCFIKNIYQLECEGWKYVYFSDRRNNKLPTTPCIYCIIEINGSMPDDCEVIYIGMTTKMSSRLTYPHPVERKVLGSTAIYFQLSDDIHGDEIEFIKRYRPKFNNRHNG